MIRKYLLLVCIKITSINNDLQEKNFLFFNWWLFSTKNVLCATMLSLGILTDHHNNSATCQGQPHGQHYLNDLKYFINHYKHPFSSPRNSLNTHSILTSLQNICARLLKARIISAFLNKQMARHFLMYGQDLEWNPLVRVKSIWWYVCVLSRPSSWGHP